MHSPATASSPLTLADVIDAVPEVQALLDAAQDVARAARQDRTYCKEMAWKVGWAGHPALKPWMVKLVGWSCGRADRIATNDAWELVFERVMTILPSCRWCC